MTQPEDESRSFRPSHNLVFVKRTCFVLTDEGETFAATLGEPPLGCRKTSTPETTTDPGRGKPAESRPAEVPVWDAARRELRFAGQIVKRYRVPARNQALILEAFQEDGWPQHIDDPLPPEGEQDPKHRLQATVKSLNRNQLAPLIRFHGNGNGLQVYWEVVPAE